MLDAFLREFDVAPVFIRVEVDAGYERRDERGEPRRHDVSRSTLPAITSGTRASSIISESASSTSAK